MTHLKHVAVETHVMHVTRLTHVIMLDVWCGRLVEQ